MFEVLTAVMMMMMMIDSSLLRCYTTSLLNSCRSFGGACCVHLTWSPSSV